MCYIYKYLAAFLFFIAMYFGSNIEQTCLCYVVKIMLIRMKLFRIENTIKIYVFARNGVSTFLAYALLSLWNDVLTLVILPNGFFWSLAPVCISCKINSGGSLSTNRGWSRWKHYVDQLLLHVHVCIGVNAYGDMVWWK